MRQNTEAGGIRPSWCLVITRAHGYADEMHNGQLRFAVQSNVSTLDILQSRCVQSLLRKNSVTILIMSLAFTAVGQLVLRQTHFRTMSSLNN